MISTSVQVTDILPQYGELSIQRSAPANQAKIILRSGDSRCLVCDGDWTATLESDWTATVEIFGVSNALASSRTPVSERLELVLQCPLSADDAHSDVICLNCLQLLEQADLLETRQKELTRRVRQRFGRTVSRRQLLQYSGWRPEPEPVKTEPDEMEPAESADMEAVAPAELKPAGPAESDKNHHDLLEARNETQAGFETYLSNVQTRGIIAIQTKQHGLVVVIPIGMLEVSSVKMFVKPGDHVKKSEQLGMFQFGGSTCVVMFQKGVVTNFANANGAKYQPGDKLKIGQHMALLKHFMN